MKEIIGDGFNHGKETGGNEIIEIKDNITSEELERQITELRKRDRKTVFVVGLVASIMLAVGTVIYISREANPSNFAGYGNGYSSGVYGSYAGYGSQYAAQAGGLAGSCCGGGGSGAGGGCGSGGTAATDVSMADLEKQALAKYKEETGRDNVTAQARDFGCHIQIDILDGGGKTVRSYGFQGSDLYVII